NNCMDFGALIYDSSSNPPTLNGLCTITTPPTWSINCDSILSGTYKTFSFNYVAQGGEDKIIIGMWLNANTATCGSGTRMYYNLDNSNFYENDLMIAIDAAICDGDSLRLWTKKDSPYWWEDPANPNDTLSIDSSFWVKPDTTTTYYIHGATFEDSVHVTVNKLPVVTLRSDTNICIADSVFVFGSNLPFPHLWSNGDTISFIYASDSGTYILNVTDTNNCIGRDTFVLITYRPSVDLGPDTNLCPGRSMLLDASVPTATYSWMNGMTTPT
ncbi:MAG: hypothetical protein IH946_00950, partial [Bacteroidetes bacterium]|nr:hypothetical protein [Bacteroidota bacterium]